MFNRLILSLALVASSFLPAARAAQSPIHPVAAVKALARVPSAVTGTAAAVLKVPYALVAPAQVPASPFTIDPSSQTQVRPDPSVLPQPAPTGDAELCALAYKLMSIKAHATFGKLGWRKALGLPSSNENPELEQSLLGIVSMLANPDLVYGDYLTIAGAIFNDPALVGYFRGGVK